MYPPQPKRQRPLSLGLLSNYTHPQTTTATHPRRSVAFVAHNRMRAFRRWPLKYNHRQRRPSTRSRNKRRPCQPWKLALFFLKSSSRSKTSWNTKIIGNIWLDDSARGDVTARGDDSARGDNALGVCREVKPQTASSSSDDIAVKNPPTSYKTNKAKARISDELEP